MLRKVNTILVFLIVILFIQCKSVSKTSKKVNNNKAEKSENQKRADSFFYHAFSKIMGYELAGTEDKGFLEMIETWLGVPYKYGGCSREGTDCSCFVNTFFKEYYQLDLPRKSEDIQKMAKEIQIPDLKTGDLVFFNISIAKTTHVGIYISKNRFVHASTTNGVMINNLDETYYKKYFYKAGRVLKQ